MGAGAARSSWGEALGAKQRMKTITIKKQIPLSAYNQAIGKGRRAQEVTDEQMAAREEMRALTGRGAYRRGRSGHMKLRRLGLRPRSHLRHGRGLYMGGRGGFLSDAWNASAGLRGQLGTKLRSGGLGGAWGQAAGYGMQALGLGAYTTSNATVDGGGGDIVPSFSSASTAFEDGIVVSSKEFVTDIYGPAVAGGFQNTTFDLNPGITRTFPWLAQLAANYEEYEFAQLIFTYKTNITDFVSTNGQVGTIVIATQYNSMDDPFTTKTEMMHYAGAADSKTTDNQLHGVECDPTKNSGSPGKYIRSGPVKPGEDEKGYDHGVLNVAVANTPSQFNNQALGELWVSYTVRLRKPRFYSTNGLNILRDCFQLQSPTGAGLPDTSLICDVGQQNRIGGTLKLVSQPIGSTYAGRNLWTYTFPAGVGGNFMVRVKYLDTGGGSNKYCDIVPLANAAQGAPLTTIEYVKDMLIGNIWTGEFPTNGQGAGNAGGQQYAEDHYLVKTPASAGSTRDNQIGFYFQGNAAPSADLITVSIDIEQYNTDFDRKTDNHTIFTNASTGQVVSLP